ncbi:Ig-like domain-containing protein [Paenibacillus sp. VMFN-D1]|uniref:Ig-like domain-containing protein n=1 Tax=Paenibacillus sp. VMFN-D1 TaxID=2135608 RepID=UPI000E364237|nr:Ig-like domain-containing protein [Paenibacillus sp. VMFN-D1]RED34943.1 Ig-like protein group 2 [Paenibacillus sp. VMFN-D1]
MRIRLKRVLVMSLVMVLCMAYAGTTWAATAELTKLVLSKNELTLEIGDTAKVTATGVYSDNSTADLTVKASWSSSNNVVATIYNGTVTAKSEGTTTVTAVFGDVSESVSVTVTKKVKALTKDVQSLDLKLGDKPQIKLTATYTDNNTEEVSGKADWSTDNASVATVVNGTVTPVGPGTATLTAVYGKQTVTIPVSVEVVKRLDADPAQVSMLLSEKTPVQVTLKATYPDGTTKDNVAADAEWTSSNEGVADVIKGQITPYGPGTATITAKYGTKTATIQVDVDKTIRLKADKQDIFLHAGDSTTQPIKVEAVYPDKDPVDITGDAVWSSSDEKVAYVNKGVITAIAPGAVIITAKYGDKSVAINVDVDVPRHLDLVEKVALSLTGEKTKQLDLIATYANGETEKVQSKAVWKSSNEDVVFVSGGNLTAFKKGESKVSATYGGVTVTTSVAVDMPLSISLPVKKLSLKVDATYQASIVLDYGADRAAETISSKDKVEWSTNKKDIADIDENGLITGVATGTATITAKYEGKSYTMTVEVGLVSDLKTSDTLVIMSAGDKKQLTLTAKDATGTVVDVTKEASWKSSSSTVAGVDNNGLVSGLKSGKANITAEYGGQKVTIPVEVDVISAIEASETAVSLKTAGKAKDKTATVKLEVTFSDGSTKDVTSKAEWKTGNYKVASVSDGVITAAAYGKTTVTAKYGNKTVRIPVEVDTLKYLQTDKVSVTLNVGDKLTLAATATYMDGTDVDVSKPALWKSSKILTATVKDGQITANGKGKATITVSFGGKSTKVVVTVQ